MTTTNRSSCSYEPEWQRFASYPHTLTQPAVPNNAVNPYQINGYSNLYRSRIDQFRRIYSTNGDASISRVIDLVEKEQQNNKAVLGTIIKHLPRPPPTIENYTDNGTSDTFFSDESKLSQKQQDTFAKQYCTSVYLEDETGRVELNLDKCEVAVASLVTGVVVAVSGNMNRGILDVDLIEFINEIHSVGASDYADSSSPLGVGGDFGDGCVLFVSGLNCGTLDKDGCDLSSSLKHELLLDYISGNVANVNKGTDASKISRVIVAGGGCAKPSVSFKIETDWDEGTNADDKEDQNEQAIFPVKELDQFLAQICAMGVAADYIPSLNDPTNANWPQMPLHPCLLPNAERFGHGCTPSLFERCTNPYESNIGGRMMLGSDGLNIADARRFMAEKKCDETGDKETSLEGSAVVSSLTGLRSTLEYSHLAPTCPSSIPTFPFNEEDPFIIEKIPDVYFAGNCEKFESELVTCRKRSKDSPEVVTRLLCIPSFSETGQVILLNLKTLDCKVLEFDENIDDVS